MTAGSVFSAAGQLIVQVLGDELPDWLVVYETPRSEADLFTTTGENRLVWVLPEGESEFVRTSLGRRGLDERLTLTLRIHRIAYRTDTPVSEVDDEVADVVGALIDLMCADDPAWTVPPGWDSIRFEPSGTERGGGYLTSQTGPGRWVEVTLTVTASRC